MCNLPLLQLPVYYLFCFVPFINYDIVFHITINAIILEKPLTPEIVFNSLDVYNISFNMHPAICFLSF